jgi:hypothetical protein
VYWTGGGGECWDTRVRIYYIYFTIGPSYNHTHCVPQGRRSY